MYLLIFVLFQPGLSACMHEAIVFVHPCSDVWYRQHLWTAGRKFEDEGILPPKYPQSDWSLLRCRPLPLYCDAIYGKGSLLQFLKKERPNFTIAEGADAELVSPIPNIFIVASSRLILRWHHCGHEIINVSSYRSLLASVSCYQCVCR